MSLNPIGSSFWVQFIVSWALDIQAANGPSRFSKLGTLGQVCPVMSSSTSAVVQSVPCQRLHHLLVGKLMPLPIPHRPWSHMGIDFVTDLPEGHCILVSLDCFSNACKLIPLHGLPTALETAEQLFAHVFRNYGIPEEIVSDWGPQFIFRVWKAFHLLGVTVSLSSGYHPQTNGQAERKIQELGCYLRAYYQEDQYGWNCFLPWAEYAHNSLRQNITGLTPFHCILCYQPPLFPWTGEPSEDPAVDYWF